MLWARLRSLGNPDWVLEFHTGLRSSFTIGRHPSCSLVLSDMHISSKHLSVIQRVSPEGLREVVVEDSSSNGTWIDAERLEKGIPIRLLNGSEIVLPCEDGDKKTYTFVFTVENDPNVPSDVYTDELSSGESAVISPFSTEEATYAHQEQNKSSEQWQALEKIQDELTLEASRLAAGIYMNESAVEKLRKLAENFSSPIHEQQDDAGTTIFTSPEDAILELKAANENLTSVIHAMFGAMQASSEILSKSTSIASQDRDAALDALHLDKFEQALNHLTESYEIEEIDDNDAYNDDESRGRSSFGSEASASEPESPMPNASEML